MDDDELDKTNFSGCRFKRSPRFREDEVKLLLELVNKHKRIILNKSIAYSVNYTKDLAWSKITKDFNAQCNDIKRSKDVLKTKWENLKKRNAKLALVNDDSDELSSDVRKILENIFSENGTGECIGVTEPNCEKDLNEGKDCDYIKSSDESECEKYSGYNKYKRSPKFRDGEVRLLLQLVNKHKKILFTKKNNSNTNSIHYTKDLAWFKLSKEFNAQCKGIERNKDVLKTKWENMKKINVRSSLVNDDGDELSNDVRKIIENINSENASEEFVGVSEPNCEKDLIEGKESLRDCDNVKSSDESGVTEPNCEKDLNEGKDCDYIKSSDESECEKYSGYNKYKRSPKFRDGEVRLLLQLVNKHKKILFTKKNNSNTNSIHYTKDLAWFKLSKEFNAQCKGIERNKDVLKTKWENMKKINVRSSLMNDDGDELSNDVRKIIENINSENASEEFVGVSEPNCEKDLIEGKESSRDCDNVKSSDESEYEKSSAANKVPQPFSPSECRLLLSCVKEEKNILFSKAPLMRRHQAWKRISESFNKRSPAKRSVKELNIKFNSMKATAKKVNLKKLFKFKGHNYDKLNGEPAVSHVPIKIEPLSECDFDIEDSNDQNSLSEPSVTLEDHSPADDPLSNVNSSDSGLGSLTSNDKYVTKLNIDLLNYNLENAKLERQRIQQAIDSDRSYQQARSLEASLRLRAARLKLLAVEAKFPNSNPALSYTQQELCVKEYVETMEDCE